VTSPECRQSCLDFEDRFKLWNGSVDLLALFDALRPVPDQMKLYVVASREMRAERRAAAKKVS